MKSEDFNKIVSDRQAACLKILDTRKSQYAPEDDRLSNFKTAAAFQNTTPESALLGMLSKHLVAISDFIRTQRFREEDFTQWEEKITDSINYLHLLEALVQERLPQL